MVAPLPARVPGVPGVPGVGPIAPEVPAPAPEVPAPAPEVPAPAPEVPAPAPEVPAPRPALPTPTARARRAGTARHLHVVPAPSPAPVVPATPKDTPRDEPASFAFLTDLEVEQMPPVHWLLDPILAMGSVSILYGDGGTGKSFLALAWSLCLAAGIPWLGHHTQQGVVAYIAAEGARNLGIRIRAWKQHHDYAGQSLPLMVWPQEVDLVNAAHQHALIHTLTAWADRPVLVVIDTLAKCTAGVDENSGKEIGAALAAATRIAHETGAHVLIVHHSTKNTSGGPRGHSRLKDDVDTVLQVTRKGQGLITLKCTKQKDGEAFTLQLRLRTIRLEQGDSETSCVLQLGGSPASEPGCAADLDAIERGAEAPSLTPTAQTVLRALERCGPEGATASAWQTAAGVPKSSFKRAKSKLLQTGQVVAGDATPQKGTRFWVPSL